MDPAQAAALVAMAVIEATPKNRSSNAERQARYRERLEERNRNKTVTERNVVTPDATVTNRNETVTNRNNVTSAISFLDSKKERKKERNTGTALPDDWKPDDVDYAYGGKLGLTKQQVDSCAEEMRLWAKGNANRSITRKADWRATFHNWLRRCSQPSRPQRSKDQYSW